MSEWSEKYKDPRWKQKRSEIIKRDNSRCCICMAEDSHLEVHHDYYTPSADGPWDYPDTSLTTLCPACHKVMTATTRAVKAALFIFVNKRQWYDFIVSDSAEDTMYLVRSIMEALSRARDGSRASLKLWGNEGGAE